MAIVCTEYNQELLDERSPLCEPDGHEAGRMLSNSLRRRCFSEAPLRNNPLSRFRFKAQRRIRDRRSMLNKQPVPINTEEEDEFRVENRRTERGDSGYFSIHPEELIDGQIRNNDFGRILSDHLNDSNLSKTEKASTFVKQRTKFLSYKHNLKLSVRNKQKTDNGTTDLPTLNSTKKKDSSPDVNSSSAAPRPKRRAWLKAKKKAAILVRFIRRENKGDDEVSLMHEKDFKNDENENEVLLQDVDEYKKEFKSLDEALDRIIDSSSVTVTRTSSSLPSFEDQFVNNKTTLQPSPFDDSFTSNGNIEESPFNEKYLTPRNDKRERQSQRLFYHSMYDVSRQSRQGSRKDDVNQHDTSNNTEFIEKYLNKSKSSDDLTDAMNNTLNRTVDSEESLSGLDGENNMHTVSNGLFGKVTDEDEDIEDDEGKEGQITPEEYKEIIEEEVDNYLFDNYLDKTSEYSNVKRAASLSYSVNDLYDLFNKPSIFNFETSLDLY